MTSQHHTPTERAIESQWIELHRREQKSASPTDFARCRCCLPSQTSGFDCDCVCVCIRMLFIPSHTCTKPNRVPARRIKSTASAGSERPNRRRHHAGRTKKERTTTRRTSPPASLSRFRTSRICDTVNGRSNSRATYSESAQLAPIRSDQTKKQGSGSTPTHDTRHDTRLMRSEQQDTDITCDRTRGHT